VSWCDAQKPDKGTPHHLGAFRLCDDGDLFALEWGSQQITSCLVKVFSKDLHRSLRTVDPTVDKEVRPRETRW
jgi:hypothetical protein